jgi:hypothetical protein
MKEHIQDHSAQVREPTTTHARNHTIWLPHLHLPIATLLKWIIPSLYLIRINLKLNNIPSASIPLPDSAGSYFDRPPIPRAVSNPTKLNAVSESTTPSQSDGSASLAPTTTTVNVSVPEGEYYPQNMNVMYETGPSKIDKLSERLGEFFLGPEKQDPSGGSEGGSTGRHIKKSRKSVSGGVRMSYSPSHESDGLTETARNAL